MKKAMRIFLSVVLTIGCSIWLAGCNGAAKDKAGLDAKDKVDFTESFQGGDGTEASPYEIGSAEDMLRLAEIVNANSTKLNADQHKACQEILSAHYILTADIDLKNAAWMPIGDGYLDSVTSFAGVFDGNGHTISGLSVNVQEDDAVRYSGLFGLIEEEAIVKNVTIKTSVLKCSKSSGIIGGIAGCSSGAVIENCTIAEDVTITGKGYMFGGIAGEMSLSTGTIADCTNYADIVNESSTGETGGIVGQGSGCVRNCNNTGTISGNDCVGGTIGSFLDGEILNCSNAGDVVSDSDTGNLGGIAGVLNGMSTNGEAMHIKVSDSSNTHAVSGGKQAGGIVGDAGLTAGDISITNCTNDGLVQGAKTSSGICANFHTRSEGAACVIKECQNNGEISIPVQKDESKVFGEAGGIMGSTTLDGAANLKIVSCENSGAISAGSGYAGGMLGSEINTKLADSESMSDVQFIECANSGSVLGGSRGTGGIAGYISAEEAKMAVAFTNCNNSGSIAGNGSAACAGGMVGVIIPDKLTHADFNECQNSGDITTQKAEMTDVDKNFTFYVCIGGMAGYIGHEGILPEPDNDCGRGNENLVLFKNCSNTAVFREQQDGQTYLMDDLVGASGVQFSK